MNWSRAKSIFLVTFLVLDLFLGYQLYMKRQNADVVLLNYKQPPKQEMKKHGIQLPATLPNINSAAYLQGTAMIFVTDHAQGQNGNNSGGTGNGGSDSGTGTDMGGASGSSSGGDTTYSKATKPAQALKKEILSLESINGKKVQDIRAMDKTTIVSNLVQPLQVNFNSKTPTFSDFLQNYVYQGQNYTLWKRGGDNSPYMFVQTFKGRPVFSKGQSSIAYSGGKFPPGTLEVNMANGKITGYVQSYLSLKTYKKKKEIISPVNDAVYNLYRDNDFPNYSKVKSIELSYYNLIESDLGSVRLFVPTWHIIVQVDKKGKEKEFFVNAITDGILTPNKQGSTGG